MTGTAALLRDARVAPGTVQSDRWLVGGVAAELALRLRASAAFIRALLFVGLWLQPAGILVAYAAAALLLPRSGARRPGWSNLVAAGRVGVFLLIPVAMNAGGIGGDDLFSSGPAVWVPIGGVCLATLIALLAAGPSVDAVDEARCRTLVLGALSVLALAGALVAGMALVPDARWDRIAAGAVVVSGMVIAASAQRREIARAAVVPAALLAGATLLLASAGARLQGGVGTLRVAPAGSVEGAVVARRAVGDVVVDLRAVRGRDVTVHASAGVGDVRIVLPDRAAAVADVRVGRGVLQVGAGRRGFDVRRRLSGPQVRGRAPTVRVRIIAEAGIGTVGFERSGGVTARPGQI